MKGKIHIGATEYAVKCGCQNCTTGDVYHAYSKKSFIAEIRRMGWKIRNNSWVCPSCLDVFESKIVVGVQRRR